MKKPFVEQVVYEVTYGGGYRFLDRCGQAMLDIEELGQGWIPAEATPKSGVMVQLDERMTFSFNARGMHILCQEVDDLHQIEQEFPALFRTVIANFGIKSIVRLGARFIFLFAMDSLDEAVRKLGHLSLCTLSDSLTSAMGGELKGLDVTARFESNGHGQRVRVTALQREKGEVPGEYLKLYPGKLPANQRDALLRKLQTEAKYRRDPRFAIRCDLDVFREPPEGDDFMEFWQYALERKNLVLELFGVKS